MFEDLSFWSKFKDKEQIIKIIKNNFYGFCKLSASLGLIYEEKSKRFRDMSNGQLLTIEQIADLFVIFNKKKTMPEFSQLKNHLYQLALHRAKVNCYPRQPENLKGFKHTDQEFKHVAALYSINTCNGGTIFHKEEPLFVPAKENTLIVFSGDIPHQPVFQTDTKLKLNVNFNLISGDISKKN